MKFKFTLPDFPGSNFEIMYSALTGKSKLYKDSILVERSHEKGKPFLIPHQNGIIIKACLKPTMPDFGLSLEINGVKNIITEKLKWFQYLIGAIPIVLLFSGGAIGGAIGAGAMVVNFNVFRQDESEISKYIKVILITLASFIAYFVIGYFFLRLINK